MNMPLSRRTALLAVVAGLLVAVVGVMVWQMLVARSDNAGADTEITRIGIDTYRGSLPVDVHPSVWVADFETVAIVTLEDLGEARWSTPSGKFEGREGLLQGALIYTPVKVRVDELIKGAEKESMTISLIGGVADGVALDMEISLNEGDRAVVFLRSVSDRYAGPVVDNAYLIDGDLATSELDERTLGTSDLLDGLRHAAAAEKSN